MNVLDERGKGFYEEPSTREIDEFLDKYPFSIPQEFYDFYRKYNGFKLINQDLMFVYRFDAPFGTREKLEFEMFLPSDTLFLNYDTRAGVSFPIGMVPFVDVQEGEIVISLREDSFGKIYFCESNPTISKMSEDTFEAEIAKFKPSENQFPGTMKELADSFTELVKILELEEW
ncbi:hypothetical protein GCE9029_02601 [Grimontia celer]|uniref:Knr4/Smi1-like domain-containing protein n=1 Tax=Grimontia celer TaxID=1796497 RepID=A0A128F4W1_9GAMM|nr:SMI1/KNR4 family protein [Grimontia celer]CZF81424.1 hypothetical protein GCE9029_02601 [Grimontia celer]